MMCVSCSGIIGDTDYTHYETVRAVENATVEGKLVQYSRGTGYYYYDLNEWKARIISADCYDLDISKTNESGNILYGCGTSFYIGNEQFNWIVKTALNFDDKPEKDWGVIVLVNYYNPSSRDGTTQNPRFASVYPKFNDMLKAFNTQSGYSVSYTFSENHSYDLSVVGDWSKSADRSDIPYLICVLSGHIFTDAYYNYNGINHIVTANQFCDDRSADNRIVRIAATRTQNLFDILNIDLVQRKIRVFRPGPTATGKAAIAFCPMA